MRFSLPLFWLLAPTLVAGSGCGDDDSSGDDDENEPAPCELTALLDDSFDDGDLATGGVSGGFAMVSNTIVGNSSVTEVDGVARILTANDSPAGEPHIGIGSLSPIDATAEATGGVTVRWQFSAAEEPAWYGIAAYLVRANTFYEGETSLALRVTGTDSTDVDPFTASLEAYSAASHVYDSQPYDAVALDDGFVVVLELDEGGWAFRLDGLASDTLDGEGSWDQDFTYPDLIDEDAYVGAAIQADNSDTTARQLDVARITIFRGICDPGTELVLP